MYRSDCFLLLQSATIVFMDFSIKPNSVIDNYSERFVKIYVQKCNMAATLGLFGPSIKYVKTKSKISEMPKLNQYNLFNQACLKPSLRTLSCVVLSGINLKQLSGIVILKFFVYCNSKQIAILKNENSG